MLSKLIRSNQLHKTRRFATGFSKVVPSAEAAVAGVKDGDSVLVGGFGVCGVPEKLISALDKQGSKNLTCISNDCGLEGFGLGNLLTNGKMKRMVASYVGENKEVSKQYYAGTLELELMPQGNLAEKIRAAGAGVGAFYTPTGVATVVQTGHFPIKYSTTTPGKVEVFSEPKECRVFKGKEYLLEESIHADVALIKAWKADHAGNLLFRATARNFNQDMAKAAAMTIVEVEELVETGSIPPDQVHLPGIYVDKIYLAEKYPKRIAKLTVHTPTPDNNKSSTPTPSTPSVPLTLPLSESAAKERIARRAAKEFKHGMYANLGIGIPTIASDFKAEDIHVELQSENGLLGMGPYPHSKEEADPDLVNAGKETVTYLKGSSTFPSSESFNMIRGRHLDLTILGALEVSSCGDLASWFIPGAVKGMGGAMDLVASCKKVIVTTTHCTKQGKPKLLERCSLPITGKGVADMIITELGVFELQEISAHHEGGSDGFPFQHPSSTTPSPDVDGHGHAGVKKIGSRKELVLVEIAEGVSMEYLREHTDAKFKVSPHLKQMQQ